MKFFTKLLIACSILLSSQLLYSQNIGITDNGATFTPDASSVLELKSTSRGVLVPRLTTALRTAIASPATGLMVYDTDTKTFWYYDIAWKEITSTVNNTKIQDTDGDTKIQIEESADEDKIRFDTHGTERIVIDNAGITQIGTPGTNYTKIEADGTVVFEGNATVWDDLTIPGLLTKTTGASAPTETLYQTNTLLYNFINAGGKYVYFNVQMPHSWKEGSNIYPHVHYVCPTTSNGTAINWKLTYTWANVHGTYGATTTITTTTTADGDGNVTADKHEISKFASSIDASGKTLSGILICRLERDATDSYAGDDALLLQIDFHYEKDTEGSRLDYTK